MDREKKKISRRQAIAVTAGAATVAGFGPTAASASATKQTMVDVVVVGAGFAGLTAARALRKAGRSVVVLEADSRVGGRTKPATLAGERIDIGGQWVGPTQTHLLALAAHYGVTTEQQYDFGDNVIDICGRKARYKGETPGLAPADLEEFGGIVAKLDSLAGEIEMPRPWLAPSAAEWDAQTVESWIRANTTGEPTREMLRGVTRAVFSCEANEISFLFYLAYIASAGSLEALIGTRGGAQDKLFTGSVWQIAAKMADELGDAVVLGSPVSRIEQDKDGVTVTAPNGTWRAKRIIVTAPPAMAARIDYSPPLPARRDGLSQRMPMGCVIKVAVAYKTAFWREQGYSGLVVSDRTEFGPWFDRGTTLTKGGALVGFFDGGPAQRWADRSAEERRARVLDDIALYFGDAARSPVDYVEEVWTLSEHHRGGYVAVPGPGVLTGFGSALIEPVGRIHWAGTETADAWVGYIDGAIRSGERVAADVSALV